MADIRPQKLAKMLSTATCAKAKCMPMGNCAYENGKFLIED